MPCPIKDTNWDHLESSLGELAWEVFNNDPEIKLEVSTNGTPSSLYASLKDRDPKRADRLWYLTRSDLFLKDGNWLEGKHSPWLISNGEPVLTDRMYRRLIQIHREIPLSIRDARDEVEQIQQLLPQVPIEVVRTLSSNGGRSYGKFKNGVITLSNTAKTGTAYHEAFHAVSQLYLLPDVRNMVYKEAKQLYGAISDIEVEEQLADDFAEYMVEQTPRPKFIQWLFDRLMDVIDFFSNKKVDKVFRNIRAGKYDYEPVFSSSSEFHSIADLPDKLVHNTVREILWMAIEESGIGDFSNEESISFNLSAFYDDMRETYQSLQTLRDEEGDKNSVDSIGMILANFDVITDLVNEELASLNLKQVEEEEGDEENEDGKTEELNIKSSLLYSGKDNATGNTKLLVATLPDPNNINEFTGLSMISDFDRNWAILENTLSGVVDLPSKSFKDQVDEKLLELGEKYPQFQALHEKLTGDMPDYRKRQFYNAFYKQRVTYTTSSYDLNNKKVEVMDADQQRNDRTLLRGWKRLMDKIYDGEFVGVEYKGTVHGLDVVVEGLWNGFSDVYNAGTSKTKLVDGKRINRSTKDIIRPGEYKEMAIDVFTQMLVSSGIDVDKELIGNAVDGLGKTDDSRVEALRLNMNKFRSAFLRIKTEGITKENNPVVAASLIMKKIAVEAGNITEGNQSSSVLGSDGKQYQTKSENNDMSKNTNRWKQEGEELKTRKNYTYYKRSRFIDKEKGLLVTGVEVFLTHKVKESNDKGTDFSELTLPDEYVDRMNRLVLPFVDATVKESRYAPLTFSDKSSFYYMRGPAAKKWDFRFMDGQLIVPDEYSEVLYNYFLDEYERVIERFNYLKENGKSVDWKKDPFLKIHFFPELSYGKKEISINENGTKINLYQGDQPMSPERFKPIIKDILSNSFKTRVSANIQAVNEMGILKAGKIKGMNDSFYTKDNSVYYDSTMFQGIGASEHNQLITNLLISQFVANYIIGSVEFTKIYTGDPAYYKDLSKRTPAVIATGQDLIMFEDDPKTYKVAVINDVIAKNGQGTLYDHYKEVFLKEEKDGKPVYTEQEVEAILAPYFENNKADGQAWITPMRFRSLMKMLGKWDSKDEEAYNKIMAGDTTNIKRYVQSMKGMHYELRFDAKQNKYIPTYLKYSQAVLWPGLIKDTPFEKVYQNMVKNGIDELLAKSAIKVGSDFYSIPSFDEVGDVDLDGFILSNFSWKLQQDLPSKYQKKGYSLEGSQHKKNIFANVSEGEDYSFEGKNLTGKELYKEYIATEGALSDLGIEGFNKELGVKEDSRGKIVLAKDGKNLYNKLIKKYKADQVSSNLINALEAMDPLDTIFQLRVKNEQTITSMITREAVKLPMPGGAFIQISNQGLEKLGTVTTAQLEEYKSRPFKSLKNDVMWFRDSSGQPLELRGPILEEGVVKPARILVPFKAVMSIPNVENLSTKEIQKILDESGLLKDLVGYRIPNQGMSSIDLFEIAGILPKEMGDSIVTYTEVTSKTGADFDIDKMYVMMYNYEMENGKLRKVPSNLETKESLQNRKLDIYASILKSPATFTQLVSPLDAEWLKTDAKYIDFLIKQYNNLTEDDFLIMQDEIKRDSPLFPFVGEGFTKEKLNLVMQQILLLKKRKSTILKGEDLKTALVNMILAYNNSKGLENMQFLDPIYQLNIKEQNMAGKAGVGQTANHLTDHSLGQKADLALKRRIGFGNITGEGYMDLSKVYVKNPDGSDGEFITRIISAFLNAYVDNAKDPYISLINNNTKTANVVFMLIRAGVDPEWVNRFMTQPAVVEYVRLEKLQDSKLVESVFDLRAEVLKKYKNENEGEKLGYSDLTVDRFEVELTSPTAIAQTSILNKFIDLRTYAGALNEALKATKSDTDGVKGSLNQGMLVRELRKKVENKGMVINFDRKFTDTVIGEYSKNTVDYLEDKFPIIQLNQTSGFRNTLRSVFNLVGENYITNEDLLNKVQNSLYSYVYSGAYMLQTNRQELNDLYYGDNSVANQVLNFKRDPNYKENTFIRALQPVIEKGMPGYVQMSSSKIKNKRFANELWKGWLDLLQSEDEKERLFAEDLVRVSFYNSGFQKNLYSFFDNIPADYMRMDQGKGNFVNYIKNKMQEYGTGNVQLNFIDQFFRHNWEDDKLVPKVVNRDGVVTGISVQLRDGSFIKPSSDQVLFFKSEKFPNRLKRFKNSFTPYLYVKREGHLYKYNGVAGGFAVYTKVTPLGYKQKGMYVYEYQPVGSVQSIFTEEQPFTLDLNYTQEPTISQDFANLQLEIIDENKVRITSLSIELSVVQDENGYTVVATDGDSMVTFETYQDIADAQQYLLNFAGMLEDQFLEQYNLLKTCQ